MVHLRKVVERLGIAVGVVSQIVIDVKTFESNLLFEERVHHDGAGAGIFQPLDTVDRVRQRRRGRHDGIFQNEAEIVS